MVSNLHLVTCYWQVQWLATVPCIGLAYYHLLAIIHKALILFFFEHMLTRHLMWMHLVEKWGALSMYIVRMHMMMVYCCVMLGITFAMILLTRMPPDIENIVCDLAGNPKLMHLHQA